MIVELETVLGEKFTVDTHELDYESIWCELELKPRQREGAQKIIDLYESANFYDRIIIVTAFSGMKPDRREAQRHQADHYRTRSELERVADDNNLVRKLIYRDVLELHPKWESYLMNPKGGGYQQHPQAPYRLNVGTLYNLEFYHLNPDYYEESPWADC